MGKYLALKDGHLVYNGYHMEAIIPIDYFDKGLAEEVDTGFLIFGNFLTFHYGQETKSRKDALKASFELPVMFMTYPDDVTDETDEHDGEKIKFKILHYYHDGIVIAKNEIIQAPGNEEKFMTLMFEGKLDNVDYDRIASLHNICKKLNGIHLKVPAMYEEVMIAQTYKNEHNISELARFTAKSHGTKVIGLTLREKAAFTSTFTGLTFEDEINMLTVADNRKRGHAKEVPSVIENIALGKD